MVVQGIRVGCDLHTDTCCSYIYIYYMYMHLPMCLVEGEDNDYQSKSQYMLQNDDTQHFQPMLLEPCNLHIDIYPTIYHP